MYGYRNILVTVPSGHQVNFIKMGNFKLSPAEAAELGQFILHCVNDAADCFIEYCPNDMSLEEWYNKTTAHIVDFVEV